jgi:probable O-glycosylation ligase (exosortase A-associated)
VAYIVYRSFKDNPIYLVLLLVFIYFTNPEKYVWGMEEFRIVFILNIVLLVSVLYFYKRITVFADKYSIFLFLFTLSMLISAIFAEVNSSIAMDYALIFLKLFIFWVLLKTVLSDLNKVELFYWACLFSLTFLAGWGVQQYVLGNIRLEDFGGSQISGSNQLASALVWCLPIAYFMMLYSKNKKRKLLAGICLGILICGIICTESRQAFLALLFYISYIFLTSNRKIILATAVSLLVIVGLNFVPSTYSDRMATIQDYEEDSSAIGRIEIWKAAVNIWRDYPLLGVGGRNLYLIADRYTSHVLVAHSTFFQILSEEGLVGILLFFGLIGIAVLNLGKMIKKYRPPSANEQIYHYALTARLSLLGVLICCFFQSKAEHEFLYWPIAVLVALETIEKNIKQPEQESMLCAHSRDLP